LDIKAEKKKDGTRETLDDMKARIAKNKSDPINVQLYKCHKKHNQDWEITNGQIKSQSLGTCLRVAGDVKANANVHLVECAAAEEDKQKWDLTGFGYVKAAGTNFCLDVKAEKKEDGTRENFAEIKKHTTVNVHLYDCHDPEKTKRVNQLWEWAPVSGDGVLISEWAKFGGKLWKPTTSLNGTMALAAASIAGVFAAAIFIGLRLRRPAAVQQPMLDLE